MNTLLQISKKWWVWVVVIVFIIVVWQQMSSWVMSRKLYNMALDNLRQDQSKVIKVLEENMKGYETEIGKLNQEIESVQKEKALEKAKAEQSAIEVARLKGKINELQTQLQNIVVSDNPDRIIDDLNKLGYGPIRRIR